MRSPRTTLAVTWTAIFVVGMLSGALGPLLPQLAVRLSIPVEALGSMFPALFVGALLTQFLGGWLNDRVGLRNMVLMGILLLTLGIAGITASRTLVLLLASACLVGLGQGALDISTNVLVAAVFPRDRVVSAVNLLHFAFGAGAMLAPMVASFALTRWSTPMPALYLAGGIGAATLLLGRGLLLSPEAPRGESERGPAGLYGSPALWMLAVLLFLYVGSEMGVGGWTTVYLGKTSALSASSVALVVSSYWLALTGGRLLGAILGARVRAGALLLWSVVGACAGALLVLAGGASVALTIAGTVLLGLSYGPIFPTAVVMTTERFAFAPSRAVSVVVSLSSLGGMVLPPLQGILLERVSPASSVGLVVAAAFGMTAALAVALRGPRAPAAP